MLTTFLRKVNVESLLIKQSSTICDCVGIIKTEKVSRYENALNKKKLKCTNDLKIVVLGLPGVGKSSIINKIIGRPVCSQSAEILTVQNNFTNTSQDESTKLLFIDIPGSMYKSQLNNKLKLNSSFTNDINVEVQSSDIVAIVLDVMNVQWEKVINLGTKVFMNHLKYKSNFILILNKVDKLSNKSKILNLISKVKLNKNIFLVNDIFIVSALSGDGIQDLKNYFLDFAELKNSFCNSDQISNPKPKLIVQQTVNSIFLKNLKNELLYLLKISIEYLKCNEDDSIDIIVNVECPSLRIGRLIVGQKGNRIKTIARETEQLLSSIFQTAVRSKIIVLLKEDSK